MLQHANNLRLVALLVVVVGGAAGLSPVYKLSLEDLSATSERECPAPEAPGQSPPTEDSDEGSDYFVAGATCDAWDRVERPVRVRPVHKSFVERRLAVRPTPSPTPRRDATLPAVWSARVGAGVAADPYSPHGPPFSA